MSFFGKLGSFFGGVFSWLGKMIVSIFANLIKETEAELKKLDPSDALLLVKLCKEAAEHVSKTVTSDKWEDKLGAGYGYVNNGLTSAGLLGVGTHLIISLLVSAVSDIRSNK